MRANYARAADIAAVQNGRITTRQLRTECGFGKTAIEHGVRTGRLHRVYHGVYALGHLAPNRRGDWHGAVLACGEHAYMSWRFAATAYEFHRNPGRRVDVTVTTGSHRSRKGIAVHRAALEPFEVGVWNDIPITSPNRTLVDLAHVLKDPKKIEWAMRELQYHKLYDRRLLELSNHRRPSSTIAKLLREIRPTQSPLEIAFLHEVVSRYQLPGPEVSVWCNGFLVDFLWPEARLIVETDGRQHDDPMRVKADAVRDGIQARAGFRTLRYRWADVNVDHAKTAAEVRQAWRERLA